MLFGRNRHLDRSLRSFVDSLNCNNRKVSKLPICTALYSEQLTSEALRYGTC